MREELYTYHDLTQHHKLIHQNKKLVLAYAVQTDNLTQCFLRIIDGKLVNPPVYNAYEMHNSDEKFVKVSLELYNMYHDVIYGVSRVSFNSLERFIV